MQAPLVAATVITSARLRVIGPSSNRDTELGRLQAYFSLNAHQVPLWLDHLDETRL